MWPASVAAPRAGLALVTDLGQFLSDQMRSHEPWNCSTLAADWCMALGHPDYASRWRDTVDPIDCDAAAGGDLLSLWDEDIGDALPVVADLRAGDIAVVEMMGLQAGAICIGGKWAIKAQRGMHVLAANQVRVLKAWRP